MSDREIGDFVFCETLAATGAWHIRRLGDAKKVPGMPFGEDRRTLCNLRAAWDIECEINDSTLNIPGHRPGHPCATCKKIYLMQGKAS